MGRALIQPTQCTWLANGSHTHGTPELVVSLQAASAGPRQAMPPLGVAGDVTHTRTRPRVWCVISVRTG